MHTIESVLKGTYRYDEGEEEGSWINFHQSLLKCVEGLNAQDDIRKSGLYHELDGSMADRMKELMPSNVYVMVTSVMKELGLIRLVKEGRNTLWQVVDTDYTEHFLSEEMTTRAVGNVVRHRVKMDELKELRQQTNESQTSTNVEPTDEVLAEIAKTLLELESTKSELAQAKARIAELEANPENASNKLAELIRRTREGS